MPPMWNATDSSVETVEADFEPEVTDSENLIPKGCFLIAHNFLPDHVNSHIVVHLEDLFDLRNHPDPMRHSGCCGEDGSEGPNRICSCGEAVATVVSDCWADYYAHLEPDLVTLDLTDNKVGEQFAAGNRP